MKNTEHEIIVHGHDHSDYFQGCGTGRDFEHVVTGCGMNAKEAYEDAAEQAYTMTNDGEIKLPTRPRGIRASDGIPSDSCGEDSGIYYYVSIRFNTKKEKKVATKKTVSMSEMAQEYYDWPEELLPFILNKRMPIVYTRNSDIAHIALGGGEFSRGEIIEIEGENFIKVKVDEPELFEKGGFVLVSTAGFRKGVAKAFIHDMIDDCLLIGCMSGHLIKF